MELNRARQVYTQSRRRSEFSRDVLNIWNTASCKFQEGAVMEVSMADPPVSKGMCIKYICDLVARGCPSTIATFFPTYFAMNTTKLLFLIGIDSHFATTKSWELNKIKRMERNDRNWCRANTRWDNVDVIQIGRKAVHDHFHVNYKEAREREFNRKTLFWSNRHDTNEENERRDAQTLHALMHPTPDIMNSPNPAPIDPQNKIDECWGLIASLPDTSDLPECYLCMETIPAGKPQITFFTCAHAHPICMTCALMVNVGTQLRACGVCRNQAIKGTRSDTLAYYKEAINQNKSSYE